MLTDYSSPNFEVGQNLPKPVYRHCMVRTTINYKTLIFLIGGKSPISKPQDLVLIRKIVHRKCRVHRWHPNFRKSNKSSPIHNHEIFLGSSEDDDFLHEVWSLNFDEHSERHHDKNRLKVESGILANFNTGTTNLGTNNPTEVGESFSHLRRSSPLGFSEEN